jgi:hypothetical protein
MSGFELGVALLVDALILATLVGLVVRGHLSACYTFGIYLLVVLLTDTFMIASPSFDTRAFWLSKEVLHGGLRFAIALELVARVFGAFPGARAAAQALLGLLGVALFLVFMVLGSTGIQKEWEFITGEVLPRVMTWTTWFFAALAALILWYRLPLDPIQKAILIGYVPYLIFFTVSLQLYQANNWPTTGWLPNVHTVAYLGLLLYWARAAAQPFREKVTPPRPLPVPQRVAG